MYLWRDADEHDIPISIGFNRVNSTFRFSFLYTSTPARYDKPVRDNVLNKSDTVFRFCWSNCFAWAFCFSFGKLVSTWKNPKIIIYKKSPPASLDHETKTIDLYLTSIFSSNRISSWRESVNSFSDLNSAGYSDSEVIQLQSFFALVNNRRVSNSCGEHGSFCKISR